MNVLSIQSSVVYGHVGNSAACFALQRCGLTVWPLHTVQLSTHTGHPGWRGQRFDGAHIGDLVAGLAALGCFHRCDAMLSGYAGQTATVAAIADASDRMRTGNARALYLCDPVIGNQTKGLFVAAQTAGAIRDQLVCRADIVTPNAFELSWLTGRPVATIDDAVAAADLLRGLGPSVVATTSLSTDTGIATLIAKADAAWLVETPRLDVAANGAGDVFAALLLGQLLKGAPADTALARSVSALFTILEATAAAASPELLLVPSQEAWASGAARFPARKIR